MSKDTVLCEYDNNNGKAIIKGMLPYGLYMEEGDDFDTRFNNKSNFEHWCASRVLSLDREHAKAILNSCALSQSVTDRDRTEIALKYNCLSLQDFYWVRKSDEEWDKINLFKNSLSNAVVDIALNGRAATIQNAMLIAPDCSTAGVAPKAWIRKNDSFYLYKGDVDDSVCKEVEASKILQKLNIPVLNYEYEYWNNARVSACKCFTSEELGCVSAEKYMMDYSLEEMITDEYYYMNLADFIIGNTDRHWGNWGFMFNERGITGYMPLMDFNHAFESDMDTPCIPETLRDKHCTQYEAAIEALKHVKMEFADLSEFKYGKYATERLEMLKDENLWLSQSEYKGTKRRSR